MLNDISALLQEIQATRNAPLPFYHYMQLALYHPRLGYYQSERPRLGREGDFVTAPEITALFGEMLTLQLVELWQLLGSPARFQVVEAGAGSGRLALDILTTARRFPAFFQAMEYSIIEISGDFRQQQHRLLAEAGLLAKVFWSDDLPEGGACAAIEGVILGNELLDALPVHWVEQTADGLREIGVTVASDGTLATTLLPPEPPLPSDYFTRQGLELPVGMRTEVGLMAQEWCQRALRSLRRGALLLVDYGYPRRDYYHDARMAGTLMGHYQHQPIHDPLAHPGLMDLTAHVDFSAMARAGVMAGGTVLGFTTQGWFLMGLGILERLEGVMRSNPDPAATAGLRHSVMRLIMPDGMGERFKVLMLGKGIDRPHLAGFRLNDQSQRLEY